LNTPRLKQSIRNFGNVIEKEKHIRSNPILDRMAPHGENGMNS
jgi:hypothetical protein